MPAGSRRSIYLAQRRYQRLYGMTERQAYAYTLHSRGVPTGTIANRMGIQSQTVLSHLYNARKKRAGEK